jgi:hypothetical protein
MLVTDGSFCRGGAHYGGVVLTDGNSDPLIHAHGPDFLKRRQWTDTFEPTLANLVKGCKAPYLVWWEHLRFFTDKAPSTKKKKAQPKKKRKVGICFLVYYNFCVATSH